MRSVSAVAAFSGPIVLVGYLVGSLTATWIRPDDRRPSDALVEVFVALASSTAAWWTIQELSPGSSFSRIGYLSNQVLSAWQSVALWTGLAVVTGLCAPVFRRFRGGTGLAATAALLLIHFPWSLFGAAGLAFLAFGLSRSARVTHLVAIATLLPSAWLGWVLEWEPDWGLTPGPEASVWAMTLSMVLGVRWWSDRGSEGVLSP